MRITIDLEPHEVAAANELLNSLKALTDQLQIRTSNGSASSLIPQPGQAARDGPMRQAMVNAPAATGAPPGFVPSPAGQATAPVQQVLPAAMPADQAQQRGRGDAIALVHDDRHVPPEKRTPCYNALLNLFDASQVDTVAHTLTSMVSSSNKDPTEAMTELVEAFELVVFPPLSPGAAAPDIARVGLFFQLLAHKMPEKLDAEFRKGVLQRVLRSLTKNRELDCDRAEVLPWAAGFAMLARLECVKMAGALQTIQRLLAKPNNFVAAITMLGKTLSVCGPMVASAPSDVEATWASLERVPELRGEHFAYDRDYIDQWRRSWQQNGEPPSDLPYNPLPTNTAPVYVANGTGAQPAAATQQQQPAVNATAQQQQAADSTANQTLVLAARIMIQLKAPGVRLAWDAPSASALVSGTDSAVCAWHVASKQEHARLEVPGYAPVDCISTHASRGQMLLAANPTQQHSSTSGAYLALHASVPGLPRRAVAIRHPNTLITSTLLLPHDETTCVSCETWMGHMGANPVYGVCLWDISRFAGSAPSSTDMEMRTLHTYTEGHTGAITCSAASPTTTHVFFSGGQDGLVRVWDTRMRQSAGVLCVPDHGGKAHAAPVAAMDTMGHTIITTGNDSCMCMWDLRQLGSNPQDVVPFLNMMVEDPKRQVPIYKLAYYNSPSLTTAALATGTGLYLLDWTDAEHPTMIPTPGYHGDDFAGLLQHDIVWAPGAAHNGGLGLLGLGSQPHLTVFSLDRMTVHG